MKNIIINVFFVLVGILILKYLIDKSKYKTIHSSFQKLINIVVPNANEEHIHYSELNLNAPRITCSQRDNYDQVVPDLIIDTNNSLESFLIDKASSLICKLKLNNNGELEYLLNDKIIWNSSKPREILKNTDLDVLLHFMNDDTITWNTVYENESYKLHIAPLAISSKITSKIIWSFISGWDALSGGGEIQIPNDLNYKNTSKVILISDNRKFRGSLLSNSDFIILETLVNPNNKYVRETKMHSSLIRSFCK